MSIGESTVRISRLQRKVIKSCEGLLGDTTKFPHDETVKRVKYNIIVCSCCAKYNIV